MDSSPYSPLRPSSEGPNPLRPYYRPPSIGVSAEQANGNASSVGRGTTNAGSGARNILSGINYEEIAGEASGLGDGIRLKGLLDDAVWKYSSVFMAQPFEVAKMILQVRLNEGLDEKQKSRAPSLHHSRASSSRNQNVSAWTATVAVQYSPNDSLFTH